MLHPWGDVSCGSDFVDDTPPQNDFVGGCPNYFPFYNGYCPENTPENTINGIMFMNFMQSTNDNCKNLFTIGQALRMRSMFAAVNGVYGLRFAFINNYFSIVVPTAPICNTGNVTVNNPNCLPVTWSVVSGPATIIGGQGTNTVTLQKNGNGSVLLRATAGTSYIDEKSLYIGTPYIGSNTPPLIIWTGNPSTDYNNVCNYQTTYTNMPVSGATSVVWTRTAASPSNTNWGQNGNNLNFYFWNVGQTATFKITASNGCGSVSQSLGFKSISCGGGGCLRYNVSPNPAKGTLKVVVPNIPPPCDYLKTDGSASNLKSSRTISEILVYDLSGNLKKKQSVNKAKEVNVNLNGLRTGTYYIEIRDGNYSEKQKIVITE